MKGVTIAAQSSRGYEVPLSICIATCNYGRFLAECIDSILNQSFSDFELIIGDNASTDNTAEVINSFQDRRIRYHRHNENVGFHRNYNWAISQARGEFIRLMCADDVLLPFVLEDQISIMQRNPNVGLVSCDMLITDEFLKEPQFGQFQRGYCAGHDLAQRCLDNCINHIGGPSNFLIRASKMPSPAFDEQFKFLSDLKLALQVLEKSDYASVDRPGYSWRRHGETVSQVQCPTPVQADNWFRLVKEFDVFSIENLLRLLTMPLSAEARTEAKRRYAAIPWVKRTLAIIRRFVRRLAGVS